MQRGTRVSEPPDSRLIGRWRLFRADASLDFAPNVSMEFLEGGGCGTIDVDENPQSLMLIYRVEEDVLHRQPGCPDEGDRIGSIGACYGSAIAIAWFIREFRLCVTATRPTERSDVLVRHRPVSPSQWRRPVN
jgi:hypothetical protein